MRQSVRLAIGALALVAGVAVFWVSISQWTRDQLYVHDALSAACLRKGDAEGLLRAPGQFRGYVADTIANPPEKVTNPRGLRTVLTRVLIEQFGFLFVPENEYVHLIETMRVCGASPVNS